MNRLELQTKIKEQVEDISNLPDVGNNDALGELADIQASFNTCCCGHKPLSELLQVDLEMLSYQLSVLIKDW